MPLSSIILGMCWRIAKNKYQIILWTLIGCYIAYFATFSVLKFRHLYAEYFDLGIMHQTVYNSYMALKTGDFSRILELTTPHGGIDQIKRMAIHNDIFLLFLAPFYFIYSGPETLLILQTVVLALGAWALFKISFRLLKNNFISLMLAVSYLLYSPMQRANIFEFHAVTFATSFILFMFYFWLKGKQGWSFVFLLLALLTKEQVGLTLGMFGLYAGVTEIMKKEFTWKNLIFPALVTIISWGWSLASTFFIIPYFRGGEHFASGYYDYAFQNLSEQILNSSTFSYLSFLLGPLSFLSLIAPQFIFIAAPEFGINLLSSNMQLRSLEFHYTSVIQPWLFIGAVYGLKNIMRFNVPRLLRFIGIIILVCSLLFSFFKSPLPYSNEKNVDAILYDRKDEAAFVTKWAERLNSDTLKISTTDQIAPYFTNRRYFYIFSEHYIYADYVIVSLPNIQYTWRKDVVVPAYEKLKQDIRFEKVDEGMGYEVYKKIV